MIGGCVIGLGRMVGENKLRPEVVLLTTWGEMTNIVGSQTIGLICSVQLDLTVDVGIAINQG
jgi:hypothetical protein